MILDIGKVDIQIQPLDLPVVETVGTAARNEFHRLLQQPGDNAPGVPQERRIGGVVDVGFHGGRVGADDVRMDRSLRNSILTKQFVHALPSFRFDDEKALVEERVVHDGSFSHPGEILEERIAADVDDRVAEGHAFDVLDNQRPEDVFGGVIALAAFGAAFGECQEIGVDCGEDLGIVAG